MFSVITHEISMVGVTLLIDERKRRKEGFYSGGGWNNKDEYDVMKIRRVIQYHCEYISITRTGIKL